MEDSQDLEDLPTELAETIRAVTRQAEAFAAAGDIMCSGLMPEKGSVLQRLNTYDERFLRLKMKLEIIPSALKGVRAIDPLVQPRLYKYDIQNASTKSGLRRMIERSWKRLKGDYLR